MSLHNFFYMIRESIERGLNSDGEKTRAGHATREKACEVRK